MKEKSKKTYRLLYIGGTSVRTSITDGAGNVFSSNFAIDSTLEHQLRAGLRFNIN